MPKNKFSAKGGSASGGPDVRDQKLFFRIVKSAFAGKRKQIHNSLSNGLHLSQEEIKKLLASARIDDKARAQDVSIEKWVELYRVISSS